MGSSDSVAAGPFDSRNGASRPDTPPAASIHARVLSAVASRICGPDDGRAEGRGRDDEGVTCLRMLTDALVESDAAFDRALGRLRSQHGLGDEELVDCYIPAIACQLGQDWSENRRSFAEVTIGTARLIAAVRDLSRRWTADSVADWRAPSIAMVVPEAEQHRLGAMIAATRFRRLGVSVQMLLGRSDDEVLAAARNGAFAMISFSLATVERVEQTRRLIQILRDGVRPLPPLVVGGAIGVSSEDLRAQLGADHVVSDPEEALRRCGVSVRTRGSAAPRAPA
jgi:methylmalonyl-CoA mutase cobalamin-binding subunit